MGVFSRAPHAPRWRAAASALVVAGLMLVVIPGVASADARADAKAQAAFGIVMAQRNLWREAIYRWQRAVEIDPSYAAAWNNLAVAYEQRGEFDLAREAYEKAHQLEPNNPHIQLNQDLFREVNDRIRP